MPCVIAGLAVPSRVRHRGSITTTVVMLPTMPCIIAAPLLPTMPCIIPALAAPSIAGGSSPWRPRHRGSITSTGLGGLHIAHACLIVAFGLASVCPTPVRLAFARPWWLWQLKGSIDPCNLHLGVRLIGVEPHRQPIAARDREVPERDRGVGGKGIPQLHRSMPPLVVIAVRDRLACNAHDVQRGITQHIPFGIRAESLQHLPP